MRVKGSTIVESLVALVIILTCISIALAVLVANSRSSSKDLEMRSIILVDQIISEAKRNENYEALEFEDQGIWIEKSVSFVNRYDGVLKLRVSANVQKKELAVKEEFVYLK